MKFAIMLDMGADKPQILGRRDGTEMWFDSLQQVLDFIKEYDIVIQPNTMVNEFIGTFVINSYKAEQVKDMLAHGIPEKYSVG